MRLRDPRWGVAAAAALVFLGLTSLLDGAWEGTAGLSDVPHYASQAERVADGGVPYRDVHFEYPPGALAPIVGPAYVTDSYEGYAATFAAVMAACGVAVILLTTVALRALGAGLRRTVAALALPTVSPLLLGSLLLTRFDLLPAALAVGALAAVLSGRDRLGAGVLGVGIAVKLWPGLLLPLFIVRSRSRLGGRAAAKDLLTCAATAALVFLPPLVVAPADVIESIWGQLSRPLQIESLGAAVLLALHHTASVPLDWASGHGSQNVTGDVAVVAAAITSVAQVAALGGLWLMFARGPFDDERLVRYAAAVVVAFIALGKVFSPQFLIWLLPLVPLVRGRRGIAAGLLLGIACLVTQGWFPDDYWDLVKQFDPTASWLVLARDLTLLAMLAVLAWPTRATERAPARLPSPVPLPDRT
jgi:hypothetical protein